MNFQTSNPLIRSFWVVEVIFFQRYREFEPISPMKNNLLNRSVMIVVYWVSVPAKKHVLNFNSFSASVKITNGQV